MSSLLSWYRSGFIDTAFYFWCSFTCLFFLTSLTSVRSRPYLDYHLSCTYHNSWPVVNTYFLFWPTNVPLYTFSLFNGSRQLLGPSPSLTDYFSLKKEAHFFFHLNLNVFLTVWKLCWRNGSLIGTKKELEIWNGALSGKGFPGGVWLLEATWRC